MVQFCFMVDGDARFEFEATLSANAFQKKECAVDALPSKRNGDIVVKTGELFVFHGSVIR